MRLTDDEKKYLKLLVDREWKNLMADEDLREGQSPLAFFVAQENYEQFVKSLLEKLKE